MRQEQPRAATGKRLRAAAAVRAGGGQQAASNEEQAASDPSRSSSLEEKQRQQVAPTSKNAVSPARSRAERPSDLNIEENARAAVTSSAGAACLDLQEEASKVDFCSMKCKKGKSRAMAEREATSEAAPRFRAAGSRNPRHGHEKTPGSPKPRHGHAKQARARGEPSPGPPASETEARPLGHQPRGGAPERPRLNCGRKAPAGKARKFSAWQILRF